MNWSNTCTQSRHSISSVHLLTCVATGWHAKCTCWLASWPGLFSEMTIFRVDFSEYLSGFECLPGLYVMPGMCDTLAHFGLLVLTMELSLLPLALVRSEFDVIDDGIWMHPRVQEDTSLANMHDVHSSQGGANVAESLINTSITLMHSRSGAPLHLNGGSHSWSRPG